VNTLRDSLSILIGGPAGEGIMQSGRFLGRALARYGYHVFIDNEYPSLIRGGLNTSFVRFGSREIWSHNSYIHLLIAFSNDAINKHKGALVDKSIILYDPRTVRDLKDLNFKTISIPMLEMVRKIGAPDIVKNSVAIGAILYIIDINLDYFYEVIEKFFAKKVKNIEYNKKAAELGYKFIEDNYPDLRNYYDVEKPKDKTQKILLTGNEAIGLASIKSGLKFFAAYPITPASPLFHYILNKQFEKNIIVVQAESELAAINMAMGASYAGARAMVATSGTGFGLMTEGFGAVAMTECPVVIMIAMRPGPGSGMPTFTSQADLRFILHASHGEFARVVVAPGDVEEAFYLTGEAFNIADKFQLPVVILVDKFLAEGLKTVNYLDEDKIVIDRGKLVKPAPKSDVIEVFPRYLAKDYLIAERILPGTEGWVVNANITEHDETGWSKIIPEVREVMANRRIKKIELVEKYIKSSVKTYGDPSSDTLIISWGSTKGPILEAMHLLENEDINVGFVQVVYLSPFPRKEISRLLKGDKKVILIENNYTGQLGSLLKENLFFDPEFKMLRDNGLPFMPEEIYNFVMEVIKSD